MTVLSATTPKGQQLLLRCQRCHKTLATLPDSSTAVEISKAATHICKPAKK